MQLPDRAKAIVVTLYNQNVDLARGDDEQRRRLARKIAEQCRFELGPTWGHKSADPTRPPSKDAIAQQQPDGRLIGWDLFNGSTREPFPEPESMDLTGQHFIDVSPGVNHLGPVPPPPPPNDGTTAALRAELAALRGELDNLKNVVHQLTLDRDRTNTAVAKAAGDVATLSTTVAELRTRPFPPITVSTNRVLGHSHEITIAP
jgi:hypothetical protein